MKQEVGSVIMWRCSSSAETGKLKADGAKLERNCPVKPVFSTDMTLRWRSTFQQVNDPKHTESTLQWFEENHLRKCSGTSSLSPDLNPNENF